MEPLNDKELSDLLREWKLPSAPAGLEEKFFPPAHPLRWWRWLLTGSIRVPVPVGMVAILILLLSIVMDLSHDRQSARPGREVTLEDFQPVKQLQPRIIRSAYEGY